MQGTSRVRNASTRATIESFVDLICEDTELLEAEFQAIVAAGWRRPSACVLVATWRRGTTGPGVQDDSAPRTRTPSVTTAAVPRRQRAPPLAPTTETDEGQVIAQPATRTR